MCVFVFYVYFSFQSLKSLNELNNTQNFPCTSELQSAFGAAVQSMGPRYKCWDHNSVPLWNRLNSIMWTKHNLNRMEIEGTHSGWAWWRDVLYLELYHISISAHCESWGEDSCPTSHLTQNFFSFAYDYFCSLIVELYWKLYL